MECNTNLNKYNIILGSKSPRRKELLDKIGLKFIIKTSEVKEEFENYKNIENAAKSMALLKAKSFKKLKDDDILICADTLVSINQKILGKPKTSTEAIKMLRILSGKEHKVTTGVVIKSIKKQKIFHDSTIVMFKELSEKEIEYYIKEFKPYDKAGSYAIQEWIGIIGIKWIKGSFFNVMGLPTEKIYNELIKFTDEES
ncbi:MAG: septum formation protein Maf [Flavobacteriales bacterium]|nr:septum formation protein Maf [Flavobacteriales bacterium]|tara:strand:- start:5969 stop:6565 length:597 start_codon:yes stop_codon:yes gene_type:complete